MASTPNEVIESTDIVSLISKYVPLEKQGKDYKGVCPFHNEKTPSFMVSPEKKIFKCFGCGASGNALGFLMKYHNIPYADAIKELYQFNGLEYKFQQTKTDSKKKYYDIMNKAIEFYQRNLELSEEGRIAKEYLLKRGIDDSIINEFKIGLAPKIGNTLYSVLKEIGFLELDISDVGLIDKNDNGYYDIFSNRIMFPIFDEYDNPIAFSARIYREEDKAKGQPKYLNSRESIIFKKGETIFNLNKAKIEINRKKRVVLHEGQMDVIASYRAGNKEAICTLGTALTVDQVKLLSKYTNHAIICYDGDSAGIHASLRAIDMFKNNGFVVHLCLLPRGMDPDEYIKKFGNEGYLDFFENNIIDPLQYKFETAFIGRDLEDLEGLNEVKNIIFSTILSEPSAIIREDYLKRLSERLKSSYDAVNRDFIAFEQTHATNQGYSIVNNPINNTKEEVIETARPLKKVLWNNICEPDLIFLGLQGKDLALRIDNEIGNFIDGFSPTGQKLWMRLVNDYYANYDEFNEGYFVKLLNPNDEGKLYLDIGAYKRKNYTENMMEESEIEKCVTKLKIISIQGRIKQTQKQISTTLDSKTKLKLVASVETLKRQEANLKAKLVKHN